MKRPTAKTQARKEGKKERVKKLVDNLLAEQRMFKDNKPVLTSRTFPGSASLESAAIATAGHPVA